MAGKAKQIVYLYNGVAGSEEVEADLLGEVPIPQPGEIVHRKGKNWTVAKKHDEKIFDGRLPVFRIFLQEVTQ